MDVLNPNQLHNVVYQCRHDAALAAAEVAIAVEAAVLKEGVHLNHN